jgi:16S rRNA (guanine527-N7)-methyltransferase
MQEARIAELLRPFLRYELSPAQLQDISIYIDILMRWNARMNLTALDQPDEIARRHFGESLFAAQRLFEPSDSPQAPAENSCAASRVAARPERRPAVVDIGSGAGFPGIPLKIWAPAIHLTLIESNHRKATFLKEVLRALRLTDSRVFPGRAQDFAPQAADVVTLRAVERFESILAASARLLSDGASLVLFIGAGQVEKARTVLEDLEWSSPVSVPLAQNRVLLIGTRRR